MSTPDPTPTAFEVTDTARGAPKATPIPSELIECVYCEVQRRAGFIDRFAVRTVLEAAAPILLAAGRIAAAADLPSDTGKIEAWLSRHGLSTTPGVGVVLSAVRRDILGICSASGPVSPKGRPMPDPGYTPDPADIELVAAAIWSDDWPDGQPWATAAASEPEYRENATAVLRALAAAGRLLPADAETRREYKYVLTYADGEQVSETCDSLAIARNVAASPANWDPPGAPGEVFQRNITTLVGPWLPAPAEVTGP